MAWFAVAAGVLLAVSWSLLVLFFVKRNETADRLSNVVGVPALIAVVVAMGAVLDRFAARAPVLVSLVTAIGLLAVAVNLVLTIALVLQLVTFPRIAMPATAAWAVLFLWVGAASGFILAYGRLPKSLGWFGVATIAYTLVLLAVIMRKPEMRNGTATPARAEMLAGAPVLVLLPVWLVWLGLAL
jgi:hypothetical protein